MINGKSTMREIILFFGDNVLALAKLVALQEKRIEDLEARIKELEITNSFANPRTKQDYA